MNNPTELELLQAMLKVSEALRAKLLDERCALMAQPSPMFNPHGATLDVRQLEREAFAAGLHHGAGLRSTHA